MVWPGVVLARRVFGPRDPSGIAAWLVGPALGLGLSVFGVFLFWAAGVQNWLAILLRRPDLARRRPGRRLGGPSLRLPAFDRQDVVAVALALLVVPLVTWAPYDHVREPVADGRGLSRLFHRRLRLGDDCDRELAKGDVPPRNPFLKDQPLRYYWMAHFLSGALYRNAWPGG